jgi:regulator of sigma E protease
VNRVLSISNLEKLGYYKVSKQEFSFMESIPVGITKGKDQLVGYGKQPKMIFSPSTGAYKQVGGFKAIFDIFQYLSWKFSGPSRLYYRLCNELIAYSGTDGHVMFYYNEIISGKKN